MFKSLEFCIPPKKRWKKYLVPLDSTISEFIMKLGKEHGFSGEEYFALHRGNNMDISKSFRCYSFIPNNGLIELKTLKEIKELENNIVLISPNEIRSVVPTLAKETVELNLDIERSPIFASREIVSLNVKPDENLWKCLTHDLPIITGNPLFEQLAQNLVRMDEKIASHIPQIGLDTSKGDSQIFIGKRNIQNVTLKSLGYSRGSKVNLKFIFIPKHLVSPSLILTSIEKDLSKNTIIKDNPNFTDTTSSEKINKICPPHLKKMKLEITPKTIPKQSTSLQSTLDVDAPSTSSYPSLFGREIEKMLGAITISSKQRVDRKPFYFIIDTSKSEHSIQQSAPELSDEFFVPTDKEVKYMMADLAKRRKELEDTPLKTKETMQYERLVKIIRYPKTIIRFHVPSQNPVFDVGNEDKLYFQATFNTTESLSQLYSFVREHLLKHIKKDMKIELFTAPPKHTITDTNKNTLFDESLYPSALLHISFKEADKELKERKDICHIEIPKYTHVEAEQQMTDFFKELADIHIK